jgi:hypothetical protein
MSYHDYTWICKYQFTWLELIHKASPTLESSKNLCLVILSQMFDYLKPKTWTWFCFIILFFWIVCIKGGSRFIYFIQIIDF